ncbi:TPA: type III-B CRISPR module RAMP protein Cmr4 [Clostridium botulinum]|uniref:type III-B CRISPR module RAMP protein Cmr4 n=1 Tax=Clostridium botulinum TaxID=1491 RepID=UPI000D0DC720|nr:type III-B CRISPR module RAMP protein Cmr4 [Clostridium botulinum]PSM01427.1 type III-B CRISPR module RAMP protein Cmr4 [Clostridium botulinum]HDK7163644.1 type III-B CRISPR module RAMP protein Cmr4 [Clostridium botulinum]HDK7171119.1 type III-B CRISPR module RAMP protein Cmr4 [Clostridium botulinum]HDK7182172.1 type III-B CRISPR module RAMP protein Cmr4 [Clostridium botulinum]HDK7185892.1 type III-B CRISPR module RAMP protein Cmr4 [Clostridium botulinum]
MDNFKIYTIRCLTNMHVGSGDASYTLIDNQVQRDVITGFPTINSSSLKGSLRSFLKDGIDKEKIKDIFGDEEKGIGKYKIFPGMLLSIPVRSNVKPFFRATCPRIVKDFLEFIENFQSEKECIQDIGSLKADLKKFEEEADENKNGIWILKNFNSDIDVEAMKNLTVEEIGTKLTKEISFENEDKIKKIFGEGLILIDDNSFSEIVDRLPVIARNKLDNGESENLWYEEVVPREARFYFGVILGKENQTEFEEIVGNQAVQIGGNATIGYGYCNIESI